MLPADCLSPGSLGHGFGTQLEKGSALEWESTVMHLQQSHRHGAQFSAAPGVQAHGLQHNLQQIQGMLKVQGPLRKLSSMKILGCSPRKYHSWELQVRIMQGVVGEDYCSCVPTAAVC